MIDLAKFPKDVDQSAFFKDLRSQVNKYFKDNNISKYANINMKIKTVFMLTLYLVPYFLMLFGVVSGNWGVLAMFVLMGFGVSGVGMSIMHDAAHGSYSKKKWVNRFLGDLITLAGGSPTNWRIQHNVLHHSFTNITGLDQDINIGKIMRFSPHEKRYKLHRFQHFYAWFLYSLMTILWITTKDFKDMRMYHKAGLLKRENMSLTSGIFRVILTKIFYYFFALVLPILVFKASAWMVVLGFIVMHLIAGFALTIIFQPAHVVEETAFPLPNEEGMMANNWAIHQLMTTNNFAPKSKIFAWLIGGLNYQVEHHLFPKICHIHYPKLSKIVKETAKRYGLPYYEQPTFMHAVADHARMLYKLGRPELEVVKA